MDVQQLCQAIHGELLHPVSPTQLTGQARQGAPTFHDFDTLFGIKGMPPDEPKPSVEERRQLGEWIACGMP